VAAVAEAAAPEARFGEAPELHAVRAIDGWCALRSRDATLDGSLPLRVVQGCEPMLDGVSFGLQVVQRAPLRVTRRWGRWHVEALPFSEHVERWGVAGEGPPGASDLARFTRQHAAALPALRAPAVCSRPPRCRFGRRAATGSGSGRGTACACLRRPASWCCARRRAAPSASTSRPR
jgi:hypothetical protein